MDLYKTPLEQLLAQAKDGIALSHARRGVKQEETKDLRLLLGQGKDAAAKLRSAIKAHFGPKSERLIQYGMRPSRSRKKASTQSSAPTTEKPKPVTPAPASPSETTPKAP